MYGKQTAKLETTATKPTSLKGALIAACEAMLNSYVVSYHVPAIVVRLSSLIYGGKMDVSMYSQSGTSAVHTKIALSSLSHKWIFFVWYSK